MKIKIYDAYHLHDEQVLQDIFNLMQRCDKEFYPPLSSRGSGSVRQNLNSIFEKEKNRHFLYAYDEEDAANAAFVGYMAYEDDHVAENSNGGKPCRYVIRMIVSPEYRGRKVADLLYDYLADISKGLDGFGVRTWATNYSHLRVLERCGFVEDGRIPDDRGPGIDSIYFWKSLI